MNYFLHTYTMIHYDKHSWTLSLKINDGLDDDDDEDVPTEGIIERMEERLDLAQNQQKRLFLIIFQVKPVKMASTLFQEFYCTVTCRV